MCGYPPFLPFIPKVRLLFNFTTYICKSNTILYWTFFYLSLLSYLTFRIKYCKLISYIQQGDDSNDRKFILYEKALFYFRYNSLLFNHINYLAPKIYFYFVSVWYILCSCQLRNAASSKCSLPSITINSLSIYWFWHVFKSISLLWKSFNDPYNHSELYIVRRTLFFLSGAGEGGFSTFLSTIFAPLMSNICSS